MKTVIQWTAAFVIAVGTTSAMAQNAHTIFVVDESGSMSGEHAWLGEVVFDLDAGYNNAGITSNYGLVGFGSDSPAGRQINVGGGEFGTAAEFDTATSNLLLDGAVEDGYDGIAKALSYNLTASAVNIILVTDEDRDNLASNSLDFNSILADLLDAGALLNAVVNVNLQDNSATNAIGVDADGNAYIEDGSGGFTTTAGGTAVSGANSTIADYVELAWDTGGAAWDLNQLRAGGLTAESFSAAFVDIKVAEVQQQLVPTPSAAIAGLAAVGLMIIRRRRVG